MKSNQFNLSHKIKQCADIQPFDYILVEDVRDYVRELKKLIFFKQAVHVINELAGDRIINDGSTK